MASTGPIIYVIRHGEKPPKVDDPDHPGEKMDPPGGGLSDLGKIRAQALAKNVFGFDSTGKKRNPYNIKLIVAQMPKAPDQTHDVWGQDRPWRTVQPLADALGVTFNLDVKRDDGDKVFKRILDNYIEGSEAISGNILLCWEHHNLPKVVSGIHLKKAAPPICPPYPDERFDLIWTIPPPYTHITAIKSEGCVDPDGKVKVDEDFKNEIWTPDGTSGGWIQAVNGDPQKVYKWEQVDATNDTWTRFEDKSGKWQSTEPAIGDWVKVETWTVDKDSGLLEGDAVK